MASPVGHALVGLAVARLAWRERVRPRWCWYAFAAGIAILPDLDFLAGMLVGDAGRFHRGPSHSLVAAAAVGLAVVLVRGARRKGWRLGMLVAALYASHLFLDLFGEDRRAPVGQPLLWPFHAGHVISPWVPLGGVRHDGGGSVHFLASVLDGANVMVVLEEVAVLGPILALAWLVTRPPGRER